MELAEKTSEVLVAQQETDTRPGLARAAVAALLVSIPLFMTNKYFNITLSKFLCFAIISAVSFVLSFTLRPEDAPSVKRKDLRSTDIAVYGFLISSVISALLSEFTADALLGSSGRCMGVIFVLILCGIYTVITRHYKLKKTELIAYMSVFVIVMLVAFMQFFGVNVLGLYNNVSQQTIENYYSTIGNINVVSSYICLCLPFIMYICCKATKTVNFILLFILSFAGFCFLVIVNSDSGYLGMLAAFCAVGFFTAVDNRRHYRLLLLASAFLFSLKLMYYIAMKSNLQTKALSPLAIALGESPVITGGAVLLLLLSVAFLKIRLNGALERIAKFCFAALPFVFVAVLFVVIYYFTVVNTEAELGFFEGYLRFNDKWATGRGQIWRITLEAYADMPLFGKLFGCGPDSLLLLLNKNHSSVMESMGALTDNAHNEFMNYLVNHGIVGLGFYIAILVTCLKKCLQLSKNSEFHKGLFAVIVTYAFQSVVNISQPLTTPYFFILMFIGCCEYEKRIKKTVTDEIKV